MNTYVYDLAASQHGLISRSQVLTAGLTRGQWDWMVESDQWAHVYRGVCRRSGAPRTYEQTLLAAALAARGVVSHRAAGVLWQLPKIEPALEITIPRQRRALLDGFEVHRVSRLERVDTAHRAGIPVTSLARTVIDVCLAVPDVRVDLVNHVLAKRRAPLQLLMNRLAAMGIPGRRGAADLHALFCELAGRKRPVDSSLQRDLERIALEAYQAGLLPEPSFEHPVQLASGEWRYPDVGYPFIRIGFEALSYEFHALLVDFAKDVERTLQLFGEGWIVVPITAVQIANPRRLVATMARIIEVVAARRA